MKKIFLLLAGLSLLVVLNGQDTIVIRPDKDALISSYYSMINNNYGSYPYFTSQDGTNGSEFVFRSLIEFDFSEIPIGSRITSAGLKLYGISHNPLTQSNASWLQLVTDPWYENSVTWNNQPGSDTTGRVYLHESTYSTEDYELDVSQFVQDWVSHKKENFGLLLRLNNEVKWTHLVFGSSDYADTTRHPELIVTYVSDTLTIYPDKDAMVSEYGPHLILNFGTYPYFTSQDGTAGSEFTYRSLMEVDFSSIPTYTIVESAVLTLYGIQHNPLTHSNASWLQLITQSWAENTVTWVNQPQSDTTGRISLPGSTSSTEDYNVDITDFVQSWIWGETDNNGILLKLKEEYFWTHLVFGSSDYSNSAKHPKLEIVLYPGIGLARYVRTDSIASYTLDLDDTKNFVHVTSPRSEIQYDLDTLTSRNPYDLDESVRYLDGMGRPIQSLGILTGQNGEDAILPVEYDRFGKATKSYLPFTASAGLTDKGSFLASSVSQQAGYYDNLYEGEGDYAYSTSISDYSPYDQLREVSAPGEDWCLSDTSGSSAGQTLKVEYLTNTSSDEVRIWTVASNNNGTSSSCFQEGDLLKKKIEDEDGNVQYTYQDNSGKVLCEEIEITGDDNLRMYYLYDDLDQLRYILPPKMVINTIASGCTSETISPTDSEVEKLCYYYTYDDFSSGYTSDSYTCSGVSGPVFRTFFSWFSNCLNINNQGFVNWLNWVPRCIFGDVYPKKEESEW